MRCPSSSLALELNGVSSDRAVTVPWSLPLDLQVGAGHGNKWCGRLIGSQVRRCSDSEAQRFGTSTNGVGRLNLNVVVGVGLQSGNHNLSCCGIRETLIWRCTSTTVGNDDVVADDGSSSNLLIIPGNCNLGLSDLFSAKAGRWARSADVIGRLSSSAYGCRSYTLAS